MMTGWTRWIPATVALLIALGCGFGVGMGQFHRSWIIWPVIGITVLSVFLMAFMMLSLGFVTVTCILSERANRRQLQLLKKGGIKQRAA